MIFSFADHVGLLDHFLARRSDIVERIEHDLLNVRGKDTARSRHRPYFERIFDACFFTAPGVDADRSRLKGQLAALRVADGFEPLQVDRFANELDPLDLIIRAYEYWDAHRWPGKSGRLTYAENIYAVFMLKQLELLCLRMWDDGDDRASDGLQAIQTLLDRLNASPVQHAYVRDARWLVQTAQGPLTKHLQPYFRIAAHISASFTEPIRLGLHAAAAKLAGGHLRSQRRYRATEINRPMDDPDILAITRNSNAMDGALLVRDLVPLLGAYDAACAGSDPETRLELADAILQGLSADPELFLTRLDLLAPCTMIEELFIERDADGHGRYTSLGFAHIEMFGRYRELIGDLAARLREDAATLAPGEETYSPHGISYGFAAEILANMALDTLQARPSPELGFEDTFDSRGNLGAKRIRARTWSALPRRPGEREHFSHSDDLARENVARLMTALGARADRKTKLNASDQPDCRLYVVAESQSMGTLTDDRPAEIARAEAYCFTSDLNRALSSTLTAAPTAHILSDRHEGHFLASAESDGTWFGVSKIILTLVTSQGRDALISQVPLTIIEILRLTCPGLLVVAGSDGMSIGPA